MSKKCQNCGTELADSMNFCPKCHQKAESPPVAQPMQQTISSAETTPKAGIGKKIASAVVGILVILGAISPFVNKLLIPHLRAEQVRKYCITNTTLKDARIKVKHLGNNRYGVFIADMKDSDDESGITYSFDGVTKPGFCLVYDEETKKWSIPKEDEFAFSLWRKQD